MDVVLHYITDTLPLRALLGLRFEVVRYVLGTLSVFFIVWVFFAPLLKGRRIRKPMPHQRLISQIKMELFNSIRTIFVFISLDILIFDFAANGSFKIYHNIGDYGWVWFVLSIPLAIILHDAYFYWVHRAMHLKSVYKLFHLTHHRSHNPTPFTAYSFAPGEAVVMYAFVPILMLTIPMHAGAMSIVLLAMIFKNALGHCGYELFPRGTTTTPLLRLNTTITHHDMHHEKANGNYGFYFTWWDKWMGTEHADYESRFEGVVAQQSNKPVAITVRLR